LTLDKVCDIDKAADKIEDSLCHINEVIDQNNHYLQDILSQVIENGVKLETHEPATGNQSVNVTVNCGSNCTNSTTNCTCPECPPVGEPPADPCQSTGNQLVTGMEYLFSQTGLSKLGGWKSFFLASSSMNIGKSAFYNKYHGTLNPISGFPGPIANFTQGAFLLRHINGDQTAEDYSAWKYKTDITTSAGNAALLTGYGGQLVDKDGKCLGWVPASGETAANY
jgi:hypothetical protein